MKTTYNRLVAGTGELVAGGSVEIIGVLVTSDTSSTCDLVLCDAQTFDTESIALHIVANGNNSTSIMFPSDSPLILTDGVYAKCEGTGGRAFVYYR
jgi:hypothetical protein